MVAEYAVEKDFDEEEDFDEGEEEENGGGGYPSRGGYPGNQNLDEMEEGEMEEGEMEDGWGDEESAAPGFGGYDSLNSAALDLKKKIKEGLMEERKEELKPEAKPSAPTEVKPSFEDLYKTQKFDGRWQLDATSVLSRFFEGDELPEMDKSITEVKEVWMTLLALYVLQNEFWSIRSQWSLIASNAKTYLY